MLERKSLKIVGECMDDSEGPAGVANLLLHEEELRWDGGMSVARLILHLRLLSSLQFNEPFKTTRQRSEEKPQRLE